MAGVATRTVVWDRAAEPRATYDTRVLDAVAATEPELVLLLGWMHRLPPAFVDRFADILNVHPAFLPFDATADDVVVPDGRVMPAFRGAHALRDALAAGAPWLGASVHRVTAQVDRGEIVVRTPLQRGAALSAAEQVVAALRPIEHAAVAAAVRRWCFERSSHTAL
jgi:phosphoribosylglycinamide formyltransferase-1